MVVNLFGQAKDNLETEEQIFADPINFPSFPGGQPKLIKYLEDNFNWRQGQLTIGGSVYVSFGLMLLVK